MRRSSLIFSFVFHAIIAFFAVKGLPFLGEKEFVIPKPIVVDFIEIGKVTETDKIAAKPTPKKEEEKPPLEPEKEEKPEPAAKNTASEVMTPLPKPKPPEKKAVKKQAKAEETDKNAPPDKKKKPKKEEPEKEPEQDFMSVLRNLTGETKEASKEKPEAKKAKGGESTPGQNAPLGAKLTMSEEDALRAQLEQCWNVPFGAKDAENLVVEIFMVINPDRTLREARVVNTTRYNADSFYRAAADSALRAVRSPLCSPFKLPPDKYNMWQTITVTFNPKDMF